MKKNDIYNECFLDKIFQYITCIAIVIYENKYYFILSNKENFLLNMKLDLDSDLENQKISIDEYNAELKSNYYRDGLWQLTKENFLTFIKLDDVLILEKDDLLRLLFFSFNKLEQERLYITVENQLAFNFGTYNHSELSDFKKINQISSRLPLFYINFDTQVYLHMNWDRNHESYAYDGWFAKKMDFGYLIPDEYCYWKINGKDFWKFRQV